MFESLTQRLDSVFDRLRGKGKVTEKDVTDAMREVRQALLEADVNFKLVKQFVARVQERAVGVEVLESLSPAQQVIGIVHEELVKMLGGEDDAKGKIQFAGQPPTIYHARRLARLRQDDTGRQARQLLPQAGAEAGDGRRRHAAARRRAAVAAAWPPARYPRLRRAGGQQAGGHHAARRQVGARAGDHAC